MRQFAAIPTLRQRSPFAGKLLRLVLSVYLLIACAITLGQLVVEYQAEEVRLRTELDQVAAAFVPVLAPDLWNLDDRQIESSLDGMWVNPGIREVRLIDDLGASVAHRARPAQDAREVGREFVIEQRYPVDLRLASGDSQTVGELVLASDASVVLERAMSTFVYTIVNAFIKTLVLWLVFHFVLVRLVARPLEALTRAMHSINPHSRMPWRQAGFDAVAIHTDDELGELALSCSELDAALTERNRIIADRERELESTISELQTASDARKVFLGHMSHELRTPLNGVLGMVDALRDSSLEPEQQSQLGTLDSCARHLLSVVNDILDFASLDAGEATLAAIDFSLARIVEDCVADFRSSAQRRGLDLSLDLDLDGAKFVNGDALKFGRIVSHLVDNAVRYTDSGSVAIVVKRRTNPDGASDVTVTVADTGRGICAEMQEQLFSSFQRLDHSTTRTEDGTGLGLTLARQFAELMGGRLSLDSTPGVGTTVTVSVTLDAARAVVPVVAESSALSVPGDFSDYRVLVAEDNDVNQVVVRGMLRKLGIEATFVGDGASAVDACLESDFDVVLMDIEMPVLDGWDATARLLEAFGDRRPGVVGVSAHPLDVDASVMRRRGMDAYLAKPVRLHDLASVLQAVVTARNSRAA